MAFPVPSDARAVKDFELVKGINEALRTSLVIGDLTKPIDVGEWMKVGAGATAAKLATGVDTLAAPAMGAKVSWTRYRQNDPSGGQGDALATSQVDLLSGNYQAKTKLFVTGSTYNPGDLLVAVFDVTQAGGILDAVNGTATARQIQAAVGRVISLANGVLHYEAPAL